MKKKLQLSIIVLGSIGILLEFVAHEFISTPGTNFDSLTLFKYYTIQSNILVVVYFFLLIRELFSSRRMNSYLGSVFLTIFLTGTMFFIFLEPIYDPKGVQFLSSLILHYINPILVFVYFVSYIKTLKPVTSDIFVWMLYPLMYLVFVTVYGSVTSNFIYPFLDVIEIGISGYLITVIALFVFYISLSFVIVKIVSRKNRQN